jgi:Repeat of unknown function (DUF5648)
LSLHAPAARSAREDAMMRLLRWSSAPLLALFAATATAEFHTFQIEEMYSNADGTVQYVVLHESRGMNGESHLTGVPLISTPSSGVANTFIFLKDLPGGSGMCGYYTCTPSPTANKRVLIVTAGLLALGQINADYVIPNGFLATNGGTLNYGDVDSITYAALPTDGVNALYRDGTTHQNLATNFAGASATVVPGPPTVTVVEYHHATFDHYFVTPVPAEIALLDAHAPPFQDWSRTGFTFNVYVNATAPPGSVAICRLFNETFAPKSTHFYGPKGGSCDLTLALFPGWTLEDDKLFNAMLSDMTGACPTGTIPVYRLYNNGMGGAPNHRFVTSLTERQNMVNQGWSPEGNGIGVETCVPP